MAAYCKMRILHSDTKFDTPSSEAYTKPSVVFFSQRLFAGNYREQSGYSPHTDTHIKPRLFLLHVFLMYYSLSFTVRQYVVYISENVDKYTTQYCKF